MFARMGLRGCGLGLVCGAVLTGALANAQEPNRSGTGTQAGSTQGAAQPGNRANDQNQPAGRLNEQQPAGRLNEQPAGRLNDQPAGRLNEQRQPAGRLNNQGQPGQQGQAGQQRDLGTGLDGRSRFDQRSRTDVHIDGQTQLHGQTQMHAQVHGGRSSALIGTGVKLASGDVAGRIEDFVIGESGCVDYVIVSFNRIPDLNNRLAAVPWGVVSMDFGTRVATIDIERERLREAPIFFSRAAGWPNLYEARWSESVYQHFGLEMSSQMNERIERAYRGPESRENGRAGERGQGERGQDRQPARGERQQGKDADEAGRRQDAPRPNQPAQPLDQDTTPDRTGEQQRKAQQNKDLNKDQSKEANKDQQQNKNQQNNDDQKKDDQNTEEKQKGKSKDETEKKTTPEKPE